jgi:hypothetical protein
MATTYTLISSVTVGSGGAANIEFTSIPGTYTDLLVKVSARANTGSDNNNLQIDFNSSSANRSARELYGTGSAAGSATLTDMRFGYTSGNGSTSNTFGNAEIYIPNYTSSNNKSSSAEGVAETNATGAFMAMEANLWSQTAAITSIKIYAESDTLMQYSTAYLYGISNA